MALLQGPTDPDAFRDYVKGVGRVYVDPLDACETAEKTDAWWPSISAVKKADTSDWTNVLIKRMAKLPAEEWHRIAGLGLEERKRAMRAVNQHDLDVASGRGTIIHWWAEDRLYGRPLRTVTAFDMDSQRDPIPHEALDVAKTYLPALDDFWRTYEPELIAAEYVAIHRDLNGVGYGGTGDGIIRFHKTKPGDYVNDWKSRGFDTEQKAYPAEGAQIAASAKAQYMVVDDGNGGAKRVPLPEVKGGVIVSIRPDGARLYPIDLDKAFVRFTKMHQWWIDRQTERDAIGRVWPVVRAKAPPVEGDYITNRLNSAKTVDELYAVYNASADAWGEEHWKLAKRRKAELAGK